MSRPERIPVYLLTGFLGAGKTVLLNGLLRDPAFADSAVVVNEFGEIGLDHLLVAGARENVVLLDAGCLCCAVLDSLKETLADLYHRRARGLVPPFRRVLIETTGLADPTPILRTLMRDGVVSHLFALKGVITVVDAVFGAAALAAHPEAVAQVALADRLVLTKTDLTGGAAPAALLARLKALNPDARVLTAVQGRIAASALLEDDGPLPWLSGDTGHHHGPRHDDAVGAHSFFLDQPATWGGLAAWTEHLRARHGEDLLRCKALIRVVGVEGPVVLHGVRTIFDTLGLADWPDVERRSRLVLIGRGLDRTELMDSLRLLNDNSAAA